MMYSVSSRRCRSSASDFSLIGLHHFSGRPCLRSTPSWDALLGVTLTMGVAAFALGMLRLFSMTRAVTRSNVSTGLDLQSLADDLAKQLGAARSHVLVCAQDRLLALTYGVSGPLCSSRRELKVVLVHELEHVARSGSMRSKDRATPRWTGKSINGKVKRLLAAPRPTARTVRVGAAT